MRPTNVNDRFRRGPLSGDRLHNYDGPVITLEEIKEEQEKKDELAARVDWRDRRFSQGHITNVLRYRQCMKLPRWKRRRFRSEHGLKRRTPQTVLNSLKKFCVQ